MNNFFIVSSRWCSGRTESTLMRAKAIIGCSRGFDGIQRESKPAFSKGRIRLHSCLGKEETSEFSL